MASEADDLINDAYPADSVSTSDILSRIPEQEGERGFLLPVMRKGDQLSPAVPGILHEPYESLKRLMSKEYGYHPGSGEEGPIQDAANVAGAVAMPGLGLSAAGKMPANSLGIFGGPRAKTANLPMLAKAKEMAANGLGRDDIRNATGWHQGNDAQWRFEIPDNNMKARPAAWPMTDPNTPLTAEGAWDTVRQRTKRQPTVGDMFMHPELEKAYPDLMKVPVGLLENELGMEGGIGDGMLGLRQGLSAGEARSVGAHELDHLVAAKEGFDPGAIPASSPPIYDMAYPSIRQAYDALKRMKPVLQDPSHPNHAEVVRVGSQLSDFLREQAQLVGYKHNVGETGARNTQARLDMTPEERALPQNAPWRTQDVPDAKQILSDEYGGRSASASSGLPMDEASRMARAKEMGMWDDTFHHATTHQFDAFADPAHPKSPYEPESHHGPAIYMTSDRGDAMRNYQGLGPDLTRRIERTAEQREYDMRDVKGADRDALTKRAAELAGDGTMPDYWAKKPESDGALAWAQAHDELVGPQAEGRLMDLRINPENPVYVGGPKDTFFDYGLPEYTVKKERGGYSVRDPEGDPVYGNKKYKTEDEARDAADNLRYESEPTGSAAKLLEQVYGLPISDDVRGQLAAALHDRISSGDGIKASEFEKLFREHEASVHLWDEPGGSHGALQNIYRGLGHDAAVLSNAEKQFPNMGMGSDTTHVALFDPRRVRSTDAKFDPAKRNSTNLKAALAGAAVLPGIVLDKNYGSDQ